MIGKASPSRREGLVKDARKIIECDHGSFTKAGYRLCNIFSEERLKESDLSGIWEGKASNELVFPRLDKARMAVIAQEYPLGFPDMLFEEPMSLKDRKLSASMVVLTLVLSIDPDVNEYVSIEMCPFAALPWEWGEDVPGFLGRMMFGWQSSEHNTVNSPPGEVLDLFERAIWSARTGDVMPDGLTSYVDEALVENDERVTSNELAKPSSDIDRRKATWFATATRDGLYPDLLRVAVNEKRLTMSRKVSNRWHHSVLEVCQQYPEYEIAINRAKESEGGVSEPKN